MGVETTDLERQFGDYMSVKNVLFVNSGSSANQLAVSAACHPLRTRRLTRGDKVLVPALCWSTTVAPLVFHGLIPVFVDVVPETLQMDVKHANTLASSDSAIRGLMLVHVMGNCPNMDAVMSLVTDHALVFIEDACEAMGNAYRGKKLGTFGDFGTFSSFYSHHMTSIEGGFLLARTEDDHWHCVMLREHGWIRRLPDGMKAAYASLNPDLDDRFLFADMGYNFRPTDVNAVIGKVQLTNLDDFRTHRKQNYQSLTDRIQCRPGLRTIITTSEADVAYLALVILYEHDNIKVFQRELESVGVETRPVISGNYARQPCLKTWGVAVEDPTALIGAEYIHHHGLYIGLHGTAWTAQYCDALSTAILTAYARATET